jgi:hypothetical protein
VNHGTPVRGHSGGGSGSGIDADPEILRDADDTVPADRVPQDLAMVSATPGA